MHTAFPVMSLNVPVAHFVHSPAFSDQKPALQVQAAGSVLYVGEIVFAGHGIHELAPVATPYVPTTQVVHTVPASMFWNFPAGHTVQVILPTGEYSPNPQDTHATDPATFLYVPAAHCIHA